MHGRMYRKSIQFLLHTVFLVVVNMFLEYHRVTAWSPAAAAWDNHPYPNRTDKKMQTPALSTTLFPPQSFRLRLLTTRKLSNIIDINDNNNDDEVISIESLSSSQLVELIELSFLQACVAMAKTGDLYPLKLFIVAVKAALENEHHCYCTVRDLIEAVDKCPGVQELGRPLDPSEKELRALWIQAIYLMIWRVECANDGRKEVQPTTAAFLEHGIVIAATKIHVSD